MAIGLFVTIIALNLLSVANNQGQGTGLIGPATPVICILILIVGRGKFERPA